MCRIGIKEIGARKVVYGLFVRVVVLLSSVAATTMGDGMHVTVGFINVFNHSSAEVIPSMDEMYDLKHPRCSGDPAFISRIGYAPESYCLHGVHPKDLTRVIGAEWWWPWKSRVVQEWASVSKPRYDSKYDAALHAQVKREGMPLKYDQFALERICLAKWQRVASKSALSGEQPWHTTEIAVVPSLIMHLQEQRWHGHLAWNLMLPKECMESKFTQAELCMGKGYGNVGLHRHYWDLVRKVHFAPYTLRGLRRVGERNSSGRIAMKPPLIVVHHSFTWDIPNFALVLRTLLEQPKAFVDRVVVACLETNFKLPVANLGLDTLLPLAAHSFTSGLRARRAAHDDAATAGRAATFTPLPLSSHLSVTVNDSIHLMNAAAARAFAGDTAGVGAMGRPLLVALPYPTGLSLVTTTSFAPPVEENSFLSDNSSGSNTSKSMSKNSKLGSFEANHNNYDPYRRRPVTILLDASLSRKGQGGKQNWVRGAVRDRLLEAGGTCHGDTCGLCHNHSISAILPNVQTEDSATVVACGWPLAQDSGAAPTTLWEKLVTSSFCLEPAGDTPTRSHMYAAVLSGCVPVLFDGRLPDYPSSVKTGWAWRDDGLRYEDFAVVVNASTVVRHYLTSSAAGPSAEVSSTGGKDLILELSRMPIDDPARFLALRRGVDRAAALLRYAADIDEGETLKLSSHLDSGTSRMDAFQQFESIVRETAALM